MKRIICFFISFIILSNAMLSLNLSVYADFPNSQQPTVTTSVESNTASSKPKPAKILQLTAGKKQFKISWKKVSGITGYQIQYSTSKKFTKKTAKSVTIKKNKTTKATVKKLKAKKKYYVRIRTYKITKQNGKIYSSWSKIKSITTKTGTAKEKSGCADGHHSMPCGNIEKWFSSRSELHSYVNSVMESWNKKLESGEITWGEYIKKCPQGYECWSCSNCGKWTGNFKRG